MRTTTILRLGAAVLFLNAPLPASAFDVVPDGASAQVGFARHGTRMAGVGVIWDWDFERMRRKSELTAHTELLLNRWRADQAGGAHIELTQIALLPSLRMRLGRGASAWFLEFGIGASWMDKTFDTPERTFSTRWNFLDMLGVGYSLGGPDGQHELGLRWTHTSNAGIREPNPGQDFLLLRYVRRF